MHAECASSYFGKLILETFPLARLELNGYHTNKTNYQDKVTHLDR
jgi:hypothetical protein